MTQAQLLERLLCDGAVRRSSALILAGVQPQAIANALKAGLIVRVAPGAYHLAKTDVGINLTNLAATCARRPRAVVCLASAAFLTELLPAEPEVTWLALPIQAYSSSEGLSSERVVRWSFSGAFEVGLTSTEICGVTVSHTGPARTVVDLLRYSRHFGGDGIGIEASRSFLRKGGTASAIMEVALATKAPLRVMNTLRTVLAALQTGS